MESKSTRRFVVILTGMDEERQSRTERAISTIGPFTRIARCAWAVVAGKEGITPDELLRQILEIRQAGEEKLLVIALDRWASNSPELFQSWTSIARSTENRGER
ncbi:MAG: hypothetical protein WBX15_16650 [Thermoanaerobaculia bacterium]